MGLIVKKLLFPHANLFTIDNCHYEKIGNSEPVLLEDLPFEIPANWSWVRFSSLIKVISGVSYDKHDVCNKGIRILRGGNINNFNVSLEDDDVFLPERYYDEEKQVQINDILIVASTGSKLAIGKAGYVIAKLENTQIGAFLRIVRPLFEEFAEYIKTIFATNYYKEHILDSIRGSNINNLKNEHISNLLIPVPPIEEQLRITKYIKELFVQIDFIEQNQSDYYSLVESLKKAILQSAIQGTLVEQCKDDEPTSELLAKIRAEKKAQLGKKYVESYIFKGDDNRYYEHINGKSSDITEDISFELPSNWCWARWGDISESIQYGYNAPAKDEGRIKMVRISDIQNGKVVWERVPYCDIDEEDINNYMLKAGDILFARTGGTVGKSYLVTEVPEEAIYAGYLIRTRYSNQLSSQYLKYFMETNLYWLQLTNGTTATAQPNCNGKTLGKMLLPIPPLAEQERIVSKINEIFAQL